MLYDKLKKYDNPHEAMRYLWNIEIKKLAVELQVSYKHLVSVLNGKIGCSKRLNKDIWEIVEKIKEERIMLEKGN